MTIDAYLYNYHDVVFTQILALQTQYNEEESHIRKVETIVKNILSKLDDKLHGEININTIMKTLDVDIWDARLIDVLKEESKGYIEDEADIHPFYYNFGVTEIRIAPKDGGGYWLSATYKYKTERIL